MSDTTCGECNECETLHFAERDDYKSGDCNGCGEWIVCEYGEWFGATCLDDEDFTL